MGSLTRTQIEADVKFRLGSRTDIDAQITTAVQASYDELTTSIRIPETQETAVLTTTSGIAAYAAPANLYAPVSLRDNTNGKRLLPLSARQYGALQNTNLLGPPTHYFWWRNEFLFYPVINATTPVILMRFIKRLAALSASTTLSALPREWDEVVEQGAVFRIYRWMGQKTEAQVEYGEYIAMVQRRLDRIAEGDYDTVRSAKPDLAERMWT